MTTRRGTLLVVGSLVGLSGCNGVIEGTTEEPSMQPPSPDYRTVEIQNKGNYSREVDIEVSRDRDGEILHEGTHNISAGETQLIYNTSSDDLGGASILVKASTNSDNVRRPNSGFDQPPIEIEPDGNLTAVEVVQ